MTVLRRAVRACAAAVATVAILLGAPTALWLLGRPLLPSALPSWAQVVDALSRPDDGRLLLGALVLVGAGAWLILAISLVTEIMSVITRRPALQIALPGFGVGRAVAATLVSALLSLGASPAIAAPLLVTTSWIAAPAPVASTSTTATAQPPVGKVHVVVARDTLWGIAERELGDPLRWREIYHLNAGTPQQVGGTLAEPSILNIGWRLQLPAVTDVTVEPGDTLSSIAADRVGSVADTEALFVENRGRLQRDGAALENPDVIRPGWLLTLPPRGGTASGSHLEVVPPSPRITIPPSPARGAGPESPTRSPMPLPSSSQTAAPSQAPTSGPTAVPGQTAAAPSHTATPAPSLSVLAPPSIDTPAPSATPQTSSGESAALPVTLAASTLIVGSMVGALVIRRRRQLRYRPAFHRIAVPDSTAGRVEWLATNAEPVRIDIELLDTALRSIGIANWHGVETPPLWIARLAPEQAMFTLAHRASLPSPFVAIGGDDSDDWLLSSDAGLPMDASEAGGYGAPFPLLVSIATDPADVTLMLDLEQLGIVHLDGDREPVLGLLRHIVAELANSPWAEDVEILLAGFGAEMCVLNPDRVRVVDDLAAGLATVRAHLRSIHDTLDQHPVRSVMDGRLRGIAADSWLPVLLVCATEPTAEDRVSLNELAGDLGGRDRCGVAILTATATNHGATLRLHADGTLAVPDVTDGPWHFASLTADTSGRLSDLFSAATAPAMPVGLATNDDSWAEGMSDDGALVPDATPAAPAAAMVPERRPDEEQLPAGRHVPESGAVVEVPQPRPEPATPDALRRLEHVERKDPDLDRDLQRWRTGGTPEVPLIAILGEPMVRAPGTAPTTRQAWLVELLVYLALHPGGVNTDKALTDLWPESSPVKVTTVRTAFHGARRWAGRGLDGDPQRTFVSDMQRDTSYRLRGHILDWDLFRRLRKRAQARRGAHHPGSVADYETALSLVRGPLFAAIRHRGYAWLDNDDQRHDLHLPGYVVDTAHELVDIALDSGDTEMARRAADIARIVDVDAIFDRPLTDLMRIAHAENNQSELERYATILVEARNEDTGEDLTPETSAILDALLPTGTRRRHA
ncbi:LysM peptidoglycan-binding domain-containing protein [Pseudonocardia sp. GCM10023141]|uniref:LysM peptidoglycan-binding domain-containing protein n=1 Tax=Pseudonocardia sp. GCM10023141 TaxID=3252653 RepID=UPI003613374B